MNKRCFIYIRVSTQEQAEEGYSLGEQEERLTKYCEAMGWDVAHVYNDGGYSGANMERPALKQMIEAIEKNKTDIVLVDKLDRLSRSQFDTLYLIKKVFNANNVSFVSRAEAFDTSSPFGRAMVGILAVFAELERERIKERTRDGRIGRVKEGKFKGGKCVSYGYDYDSEKGYLIPNDYEKLIVNEIFEMVADRVPFRTIARRLNEKGYHTKNGCEWYYSAISVIAKNKTYLGLQSYKGEWLPALHEAIVPAELFQKAQDVLAERDKEFDHCKPNKRYNAPLSGLIYCARCGAKYHYRNWGKKKSVYMCYSRSKSFPEYVKDPNCTNTTYETHELEEAIFNEIRKLKSEPIYVDDIKNSMDATEKIEIVSTKIDSLDSQISKMMDLYSIGSLDFDTIKARIDSLTKEKESLKKKLNSLEKQKSKKSSGNVVTLVDLFDRVIARNDMLLLRSVIMDLINYIEIDGDVVSIHWNF